MVRYTIFMLGFVFLLNSVYAKGVEMNYKIEVNQSNKSIHGNIESVYQDNKVYMKINMQDVPMGNTIMLMDLEKDTRYTLFPDQKTYHELGKKKLPTIKNTTAFKPTKETKKIAGHACKIYVKKDKKRIETVCASNALYEKYKPIIESFKLLGEKKSFQPNDLEGFPLEFVATENGKMVSHLELISLKEKTIQASTFTIPKNYKKVESSISENDMQGLQKSMMDASKNGGMDAKKIEEIKKMAEEMQKKYQGQTQ